MLSLVIFLVNTVISTSQPPNILIITADDFLYTADMSHSYPPGQILNGAQVHFRDYPTPSIQNLLDDGAVIFPRTYAAAPVCSPSRYSALTGRYAPRNEGAQQSTVFNGNGFDGTFVDVTSTVLKGYDSIYNVPNTLQNDPINPYFTGMVGKWHLMKNSDTIHRCQDMGREPASSTIYQDCVDHVKTHGFDSVGAWYHGNIEANVHFSHNPEWMVSEAQKMINQAVNVENKPFYLYFSTTLTHSPSVLYALENFDNTGTPKGNLVGDEIPNNTGMKTRAQIISEMESLGIWNSNQKEIAAGTIWMDDAIGALINYLKDPSIDQYDNTLILIGNDHGGGAKNTLYEQGSRIMQFIRYPPLYSGSSPFIMPQSFISSNVDFAATIFDITGVAKPSSYIIDGKSWYDDAKDIIDGTTTDNTCCKQRYIDIDYSHSIIKENYQYIWRSNPMVSSQASRYLFGTDVEQLYDLNSDPNQQNNVISDSSLIDIICEFKIDMVRYIRSTACPIDVCNEPNLGSCLTASPTKSPTQQPTVPSISPTQAPTALTDAPSLSPTVNTACDWISTPYAVNFGKTAESEVLDKMPTVKKKFAKSNSCVEDEDFDFVFQTNYNKRRKRLTIRIVACCGNSADIMKAEEIPRGYARSSSAFNSTYFEEDEPLGAKEIVVLCISALIVVGIILIGVYLCKKYKEKQALRAAIESEMSANMPNRCSKVQIQNAKKQISPMTTNSMSIDI